MFKARPGNLVRLLSQKLTRIGEERRGGDGSFSTVQAQGPEFDSPAPT